MTRTDHFIMSLRQAGFLNEQVGYTDLIGVNRGVKVTYCTSPECAGKGKTNKGVRVTNVSNGFCNGCGYAVVHRMEREK